MRMWRIASSGRRRQRLLDHEGRIYVQRDANPNDLFDYVRSVNAAWVWCAIAFALATGLAALIGTLADGRHGRLLAIALLQVPTWFCIAGCAYTAWRCLFADAARRRYRRDGLTESVIRTMKRARLHNRSVIAQSIVAALALAIALP
jgi:hypothetical protein